LKKNRMDNRCF